MRMGEDACFPEARIYCLYVHIKIVQENKTKDKVRKLRKVENIVRMGEDAGFRHPLPFPQSFKRPISL